MICCIPTLTALGRKAELSDHFGSSPYFTLIDPEKDRWETVVNSSDHHEHGQCLPLAVIGQKNVRMIVCRGMGRRAVQALNASGIRVYVSPGRLVEDVLQELKENQLSELTIENSCGGQHQCH